LYSFVCNPGPPNKISSSSETYEADYVTPDGQLVIDDPKVRQKLIKAIEAYTAIYRKGCAPPDSTTWDSGLDNNRRFLDQARCQRRDQGVRPLPYRRRLAGALPQLSPVSLCCRPCRRCSTSPSGSTRAIRTTWLW